MYKELLKKLGLAPIEGLDDCFEAAKTQHGVGGNAIFSPADTSVFGRYEKSVMRSAKLLSEDGDNALYAYFLAELIRRDNLSMVGALMCPRSSENSEIYDTLPIFSLVYLFPKMLREHKARGIPEEVTRDTVAMLENQIGDFEILRGHVGISFFTLWFSGFINCRIIRVGRFNLEVRKFTAKYEILRHGSDFVALSTGERFHSSGRVLGSVGCEDEENSYLTEYERTDEYTEGSVCIDGERCSREKKRFYFADGWESVLREGDTVVSIHIPTGGKLPPEVCDRDIARGGEIISRCFGDFKAYFCSSWLLDPQIEGIVGRKTNISLFGDRFIRFPHKSSGGSVIEYIWGLPAATPPEKLPDYNSFANAIRAHLRNGGHIYGASGVFFDI